MKTSFLFNEFQEMGEGGGGGSQTPAVPVFDYDRLGQAVAQAIPQPSAPPPQQAEMSEEDFRKHTKYWEPDQTYADELFNPETSPQRRHQLLQQFAQNVYGHATTVNQLSGQALRGYFDERITPLMTKQQEAQLNDFNSRVETAYPSLKGKGQLMTAAIQQLNTEGFKARSAQEAHKAVAERAALLAQQVDPNFSLQAGTNGSSTMPTPAGVNNRGGSAPNGSGGGGKQKPWFTHLGRAPR